MPRLPRPIRRALRAAAVRAGAAVVRLPHRRPAPDRPRVCFVLAHAWGVGGTIRTTLTTAAALAGDYDVTVLSTVRLRGAPGLPVPAGVRLVAADDQRPGRGPGRLERGLRRVRSVLVSPHDGLSRRCSLWSDLQLVLALRRLRPQVLVGTRPSLTALLVRLRPRGAVLVGHEHLNLETRPGERRNELLATYSRLDALITLTERDREAFASALPGLDVRAIPNPVPPLPSADRSRDRIVLAVGRLSAQKDHAHLIEAFVPVAAAHPDWQLRICGSGPQAEPLARQITALGLEGRVVLAGSVRDIEREYARASVFALSSRYEGFPMVLLEAMSQGLPVVSTDCPTGPGELIEHGHSGLLTPLDDTPALTAALLRLIRDPELRERLAAEGAAVAERYGVPRITAQWRELLRNSHHTCVVPS